MGRLAYSFPMTCWGKDTGIKILYTNKIFLYRVGLRLEGQEVQVRDSDDQALLGTVKYK